MNELDVYYRALLEYRKQTAESAKCSSLKTAIARSSIDEDKITVKTATCTIEEDWVLAIEEGLVHIEKAIRMERQFIRSNGEVVPIEKVKHVSKESVEHLAKHSNLITRYNENEDIVPDKLYTVERLSDYAVYENRFLYMLLCYLRDFVTIRYNEILDLTNKYDATIDFNKKISNGKQTMSYTLSMHDTRRDDEYLKANNPAKAIIDRIDLILKTILAYLATPLMEEVSKTPMLKPPITKTNVLKMNNSFKGAMALYEFIVSYDKKGYTVEIHEKVIAPFRDELADEMAEAGGIVAFLAYEWGLGLKADLKEAYRRDEERRTAAEIERRAERITAMKRRLKNNGVSMEEYIIVLEKQLKALENESKRAEMLADEVVRLKTVEKEQLSLIASLNEEIVVLKNTIIEERQRHFQEMEALKKEHEEAMHALIVKHEQEIATLIEQYTNEIAMLNEQHANEIAMLKEQHAEEIFQLKSTHEEMLHALKEQHEASMADLKERMRQSEETYKLQIKELQEKAATDISALKAVHTEKENALQRVIDTANANLEKAHTEYDQLLKSKRITEARIKAIGGVERDFTDKDSFDELENEYNAFRQLYKEQWAKAKHTIRKKHINKQNIKGQTEDD